MFKNVTYIGSYVKLPDPVSPMLKVSDTKKIKFNVGNRFPKR